MSFAAGSCRDFGCRDFCFSATILASFATGSRRDFGLWDFCYPARILVRFAARSRQDFGRQEFRFPVAKISPGSWRDSGRDRDGIPPKSRSLFYKGRIKPCREPHLPSVASIKVWRVRTAFRLINFFSYIICHVYPCKRCNRTFPACIAITFSRARQDKLSKTILINLHFN